MKEEYWSSARHTLENSRHLSEACVKLDKWAEDMEKAVARQMDDTKRKIADIRRKVRLAHPMKEQADLQDGLKKVAKRRPRQQQTIFDLKDEIARKRDLLVDQLTSRTVQKA